MPNLDSRGRSRIAPFHRQWSVETTSGPRSFQTHLDDWPRVLPDGGLLVRDVAGDLYRLRAPHTLDRKTRDLLWAFADL